MFFPVKNNAPGICTFKNSKIPLLSLLPKYQINKHIQGSMGITNKVSIAEIPGWHNFLYAEIHEHSLQDKVIREWNQRREKRSEKVSLMDCDPPSPKIKVERKYHEKMERGGESNCSIHKHLRAIFINPSSTDHFQINIVFALIRNYSSIPCG